MTRRIILSFLWMAKAASFPCVFSTERIGVMPYFPFRISFHVAGSSDNHQQGVLLTAQRLLLARLLPPCMLSTASHRHRQ